MSPTPAADTLRRIARVVLLALALALAPVPGSPTSPVAHAADNGTWSVYPTPSKATDPASRTYFTLTSPPGATLKDHVTISNQSDHPITFKVYGADAYNTPATAASPSAAPTSPRPTSAPGSNSTPPQSPSPRRDRPRRRPGDRTAKPSGVNKPGRLWWSGTAASGEAVDHCWQSVPPPLRPEARAPTPAHELDECENPWSRAPPPGNLDCMKNLPPGLPSANSPAWHNRRWWDQLGYLRVRSLANPNWSRDMPWLIKWLRSERSASLPEDRPLYDRAITAAQGCARTHDGALEAERAWDRVLEPIDELLERRQTRHLDRVRRARG